MVLTSGNAAGAASATSSEFPEEVDNVHGSQSQVDEFDVEVNRDSKPLTSSESNAEFLEHAKKRQRASIWDHFERYKADNGFTRARCNYCPNTYAADSIRNGTRALISHLQKCPKYPPNTISKKNQKVLSVENPTERAVGFSQKELVRKFVQMVVVDELPFSFGEGDGFRDFCSQACPRFKIPCRQTVAKDVLNMYYAEKESLKELIKSYRVCITTDTWTSLQNINYMVITAHFIDSDWVLHKKIINFCVIPNHKGESIGRLLEDCLLGWGIEKLLTVTVDNASSNDSGLSFLMKRMPKWKCPVALLNNGENFHVRCIAHILNLIVNDGLNVLNESIQSIRNAIRYVRSSPSRFEIFKKGAEKAMVDSKGLVVLDVPTRWNSTYLMLESAIKFRGAFEVLVEDDPNYAAYFVSDRRVGPPSEYDWEVASSFAAFLKPFYEVTLRVCCTYTPTIQCALLDVYRILTLLRREQKSVLLSGIASTMQAKFDKYWGEVERMNQYYFVALVLDPRHKLDAVEDCFGGVFEDDDDKVAHAISRLKILLTSLHKLYEDGESGDSAREDNVSGSSSGIAKDKLGLTDDTDLIVRRMRRMAKKEVISNDLDRYLLDPIETIEDSTFEILSWWKKIGESKYPILSRVARDVLAIPTSTIASESCFSTSGRVINSYRSSLSPEVVEALICTQNWLTSINVALHLEPSVDEVECYHALAQEMTNGRAKMPQSSNS